MGLGILPEYLKVSKGKVGKVGKVMLQTRKRNVNVNVIFRVPKAHGHVDRKGKVRTGT